MHISHDLWCVNNGHQTSLLQLNQNPDSLSLSLSLSVSLSLTLSLSLHLSVYLSIFSAHICLFFCFFFHFLQLCVATKQLIKIISIHPCSCWNTDVTKTITVKEPFFRGLGWGWGGVGWDTAGTVDKLSFSADKKIAAVV